MAMELADQSLFGDWSSLEPCTDDTPSQRQRKKGCLLAIREVYAGLLSRGPPPSSAESLPADEPSSLGGAEAPGMDLDVAERDALAAAAPQQLEEPEPAPAAWEAAATNLPALDECLTPLAAQTLLGPGLGGRRVSRLGRLGVLTHKQAATAGPSTGEPAAAALTAQGLKLQQPGENPALEFFRKHVTLQPPAKQQQQQQQQRADVPGSLPLHPTHPLQQQQPEAAQEGRRQGRQWRAQPQIVKALQGGGRRRARSSGGSFGAASGGFGAPGPPSGVGASGDSSSPLFPSPSIPILAAFDCPSSVLPVPPMQPSRFKTTTEAVAALAQGSGGSAAAQQQQQHQQQGADGRADGRSRRSPRRQEEEGEARQHAARSAMPPQQGPSSGGDEEQLQQQQQPAEQQQQEQNVDEDCTLPPPSDIPAPMPFGSGTELPDSGNMGVPAPAQQQQQRQQQGPGWSSHQALAGQQDGQQEEPIEEPSPWCGGGGTGQQQQQQQEGTPREAGSREIGSQLPSCSLAPTMSEGSKQQQQQQQELGVPDSPPGSGSQPQASPILSLRFGPAVPPARAGRGEEAGVEAEAVACTPTLAGPAGRAQQLAQQPQRAQYAAQPAATPATAAGTASRSAAAGQGTVPATAATGSALASRSVTAAAARQAAPGWDSIPPTPAGLLDFSELAVDAPLGAAPPLSFPLSFLEGSFTGLTELDAAGAAEAAAGTAGIAGAAEAAAGTAGIAGAAVPARPPIAAGEAAAGTAAAAGRREASREAGPLAAHGGPGLLPQPAGAACGEEQQPQVTVAAGQAVQQWQQQQQHLGGGQHGQLHSSYPQEPSLAGAPCHQGPPILAPSCGAARSPSAAAAAAPVLAAAAASPLLAAPWDGPVPGVQLRLPQPALLAVAAPGGRYAAVLLGSFAGFEPTEVLVLQLGQCQVGTQCQAGVSGDAAVPGPQAQRGAACGPQAEHGGWGSVQVVASVPVRQSLEHPEWQLNSNSLQLAVDARGQPVLLLSAALEPEELPSHLPRSVAVINCSPGGAQLLMGIETREPAWSLLWLEGGNLLAAGHGGVVQRCQVDLTLRQYTWEKALPPAIYHRFELIDLCRLSVSPSRPSALTGVSSDGVLALWDLPSGVLLSCTSSFSHQVQSAHLVGWEDLLGSGSSSAAAAATVQPNTGNGGSGGGGGGSGSGSGQAVRGPYAILAQLRPRDAGPGDLKRDLLCALAVHDGRLTLGGSVRIQDLSAAALCGGLCVMGTRQGQLHIWDLAGGEGRQLAGGVGSQSISCVADVTLSTPGGCGSLPAAAGAAAAGQVGAGKPQRVVLVTAMGGNCLLLDLDAALSHSQPEG